MAIHKASAFWEGDLFGGKGGMEGESGVLKAEFSAASRFDEKPGTSPEELIGAAHAGCFSMALSHELAQSGHTPTRIETKAAVHLVKGESGFRISRIRLETVGTVEGIDQKTFNDFAERAKQGCPVSKALTGVDIHLQATLRNR